MADRAIARGFDQELPPTQRLFLYLPFEHSENMAQQERGLRLIGALPNARVTDFAERHASVIRRFGRFPHRNAVLGRQSTPEEIAYLQENPAPFG